MNKPIRRVAFVAMIMFALLLANGTYMMIFRQSSLAAQPQNRRVRDAEFAQNRGAILAAGKTEIAKTVPAKDRFKYQRVYPDGELYAADHRLLLLRPRQLRLESTYNAQLAGTDDALFVRRLVDLATNRTPEGASVQTTIVPKIQQAAADALGNQKGAVVALDPKTGAVLAMVTSPSFDPNDIASHDIEAAGKAYDRLASNPQHPLSNRAAREIYPPGSTFKLVTAAAALADGKTPDSMVDSPDRLKLPGTRVYLPNSTNCGGTKITITQALKVSCNTAFANLGLEVGEDKLREQAQLFGFDRRHLRRPRRRGQPVPRRAERCAAGAERDRPVRRRGQPAADGDGVRGDRQRRRADGPVRGEHGASSGPEADPDPQARGAVHRHDPRARQGAAADDGRRGQPGHRPATRRFRASRSAARPARPSRIPSASRSPGSPRSRRWTTRRSPSR